MTRRVQFAETDMAGIMHFAHFFRFMEETEHAFFRSLGFSVQPQPGAEGRAPAEGARIGWPRVKAACDFQLPLRFEEEVEIELLIEQIRGKSVHYLFRFWKDAGRADEDRKLAASGHLTVVCVEMDPEKGVMRACSIPDEILEKLSEAPADLIKAT